MTALEEAQARVITAKRRRSKVQLLIKEKYGTVADLHCVIWRIGDGTRKGRDAIRTNAEYLAADQEYQSAVAELAAIEKETSTTRGTA